MKTTKLIIILIFILNLLNVKAQDSIVIIPKYDKISLGLGAGMDYGGFGGSFLIYPQKNIGLFAGAGYALAGFGYNVGVKARFVSDKKFTRTAIYLTGMYGYNAAIKVENAEELNKLFYGPTFGLGCDFRSSPLSKGYFTVAVLVPIRSSEVDEYFDDLKTNHNVEFKNELFPIGISLGFRFILN